ncbi:von Willebrand factor A domain-containing protein 7-like [Liolophura sinensis]|uniref:von Willebrand factor A domain-containing protein 7-like n=1 Tax=Liolophura sinensis TaxID=3198878 RepID=UPI003158C289
MHSQTLTSLFNFNVPTETGYINQDSSKFVIQRLSNNNYRKTRSILTDPWDVDTSRSFYPNSIGVDISKNDYTITSITREAILNVTAQFLQSLLPNSTAVSLETLDPLTESSLFNAYYGGEVSAKKFSGNVLSIATSAMKFCRLENRAAHFFSEEIADGLALLLSLRMDLERVLSKPYNLTNFDVVRELIGAVICVQSSFYSNTNWVETHGSDLYEDLVGLSEAGKCSHGGMYDSSRTFAATGGINKETSNPLFSPHHQLHAIAGQSAVKAAINLFQDQDNGILAVMGDKKFKTLLGLGTGVTLCVVMDTTGSMLDDINAVKQQTQSLVNTRAGTVHLPESFIFVPFADPDIGPVQEVANGAEFLQILQDVVPHGGGDCPERTLEGILLGLQATAEFSKVFIFTDANAKDGQLMDKVIATAFSKQITGGNVFYSSKSDINEASGVLDLLSGGDQVSLLRITTSGKRDYNIPVDETLRDFSVFISSTSGTYLPGMSLLTPSGA